MKRKSLITILIVTLLFLIYFIAFTYQSEKINMKLSLHNNTSYNIKTDISILYGPENTSQMNHLISLNYIENNSEHIKTTSFDRLPGDFGIKINIEGDSSNSFYFFSTSNHSDININIEMIEDTDGAILVQGNVITKINIFPKSNQPMNSVKIKGTRFL